MGGIGSRPITVQIELSNGEPTELQHEPGQDMVAVENGMPVVFNNNLLSPVENGYMQTTNLGVSSGEGPIGDPMFIEEAPSVHFPLVFTPERAEVADPVQVFLDRYQDATGEAMDNDLSPNGFKDWPFRLPGGMDIMVRKIWDWGTKRRREMSRYIRKKGAESHDSAEEKINIRRGIRGYHRGEIPHAGYMKMVETTLRIETVGRTMQIAANKRNGNLAYLEGGAGSGLLTKMLGEHSKGKAGLVSLEVDEHYAEWLNDRRKGEFDIETEGDSTHISQLPENVFVAHADLRNAEMPWIDAAFFQFSLHHLSHIAKVEVMRKIAQGLRTAFEQGNIAPYVVLGDEIIGMKKPRTFEEAMEFIDELHGWSYECARRKLLLATQEDPNNKGKIEALKELMDNESASLADGLNQIAKLKAMAAELGYGNEWISPVQWEKMKREGVKVVDEDGELKVSYADLEEIFEEAGMEITFHEAIAPAEDEGMTIRNRAGVVVIVAQLKEQVAQNSIKIDPNQFSSRRIEIPL